jgi:hypothetical protein
MRIRELAVALFAAVSCAASAEIVFDNLQEASGAWGFVGDSAPEFGDRLLLGGTARDLESVSFLLISKTPGSGTGTFDPIFRVYAVDPSNGLLGDLLSVTTLNGFSFSGTPFAYSVFVVTAEMPAAVLPDEVFATIEIPQAPTNQGIGPRTHPFPAIGSSDPDVWYYRSSGIWAPQSGGAGGGNLSIGINAVPEPASCIVLALGALGLVRLRRRRAL